MQTDFDSDLQSYFTNAEYQRNVFENFVSATKLPKRLIVFHGVGGVGKSSLLRMFRIHCKNEKVPVTLVSGDDVKSVADIITRLMEDFKGDQIKFPALSKTLGTYKAIQARVEDQLIKSQNKMADIASKAASKTAETAGGALIGAVIGSVIPVVGTSIGGTLGGVVSSMSAEAFADWLRGFLSKPDIDLLLDPDKKLSIDFLEDIARAATNKRMVLLLDTFEQMSIVENWVGKIAQKIHPNVLMVIAGRKLPTWNRVWSDWVMNAQVEELKPMTEDDMRLLIHRYYSTMRGGEPDPTQIKTIVSFAHGLPIVVTSAVQLWIKYGIEDFQAVKVEIVANLVDKLMEGVPSKLIPVLEAAAVVRWFDQPILRAVTGLEDVRDIYNELRRFPFVRTRVEGLALHDSVREIIDENLRTQDIEKYSELHERAAMYFEKRLEKAETHNLENLLLERVFHRIKVERQLGINLCVILIEEAIRLYALSFGDLLLKELSNIDVSAQSFPQFFYSKGLMSLARNSFDDAVSLFEETIKLDPIPAELRFKATERLAYTLAIQGRLEDALQYYEKAIIISTETQKLLWQINAWNGIETVLRRLGHIGKAIKVLQKCIDTCNNIGIESSFEMAWAQDSLGTALMIAGHWSQAVYHYQKAYSIYGALGNDYNQAIVLSNITQTYQKQGHNPDQVIANFQKSLQTFEKFGDKRWIQYSNLNIAETLIEKKQMDQAERILDSIENTDTATDIRSNKLLGSIQQYREEWEKAINSYTKASHLSKYQKRDRDSVDIFIRLSAIHFMRDDIAALLPLLDQAEQLAQQHEYNDYLASLRLIQSHLTWKIGTTNKRIFLYQQAMIYALRYNCFLLDDLLSGYPQDTMFQSIISYCLDHGEEGKKTLIALRDWWKTGSNDLGTPKPDTISPIPEGISLLEAERFREREKPSREQCKRV